MSPYGVGVTIRQDVPYALFNSFNSRKVKHYNEKKSQISFWNKLKNERYYAKE